MNIEKKENVLVIEKAEKGHYFNITQSLEDIERLYPKSYRSTEHRYKTNNWLKIHGVIKRRKPFKKEYIILDEFYKI